jgi:glycosyltransferase involved in cell wall biosynthesis
VHFWQSDQDGPGWLRVEQVQKYLNKLCGNEIVASYNNYMHPAEWVTTDAAGQRQNVYDLTVHQRQYGDIQLQNLRYLQTELRVPCVYEVDDYLHGLSPYAPAYFVYNDPKTKTQRFNNINAYLREAAAMTVTTDFLKRMYSKYNKNIYVLPNCLDYEIFNAENTQRPDHGDEIWIGWAGGVSHVPDVQIIVDVIKKVLRDFPQTKFVIGGWNGHYKNVQGRPFYVWEGIPEERFLHLPWVKERLEYPKMLTQFDIGLAPLVDIPFNRCKSNLKFLEYSACGVPTIASQVEPYTRTITEGKTGLLVTTEKQKLSKAWYQAIKTLIENRELRLTLAENAKQFVKQNFDMALNIHRWQEVYKEIIERFRRG